MDKSKRILLVEDDPMIAMDFEMSLADLGWEVLGPAATSKRAYELIAKGLPDIAVLDFNVRGGTTEELARHLFENSVPVLFMSGDSTTTEISELKECRVLSKPVLIRVLEKVLSEISDTL